MGSRSGDNTKDRVRTDKEGEVMFKRRKRDWVTVRLVTSTGQVHIVNAPPGSTVEIETNGSLFSAVNKS